MYGSAIEKGSQGFLKIARLLVRFDQVAHFIVNTNSRHHASG
jgi:hypothetical protein